MAVLNGLIICKPSTVSATGTGSSATINTNGSVTFSSCDTLSLNGVFSSSYDNYMIVVSFTGSALGDQSFRLRVSGTDNSTASSYTTQVLQAVDTTLSPSRGSAAHATYSSGGANSKSLPISTAIYVFGPNLAQATAARSITEYNYRVSSTDVDVAIRDCAITHNQSTAYDGITLFPQNGTFTGLITVYGFNQ